MEPHGQSPWYPAEADRALDEDPKNESLHTKRSIKIEVENGRNNRTSA